MAVGIHHIDKPLFLELFFEAHTKTFTSKNNKSGFKANSTQLAPKRDVSCQPRVGWSPAWRRGARGGGGERSGSVESVGGRS